MGAGDLRRQSHGALFGVAWRSASGARLRWYGWLPAAVAWLRAILRAGIVSTRFSSFICGDSWRKPWLAIGLGVCFNTDSHGVRRPSPNDGHGVDAAVVHVGRGLDLWLRDRSAISSAVHMGSKVYGMRWRA